MLRGFRWQFVAFLIAAALFMVGLFTRLSSQPAQPTQTPDPTVSLSATSTSAQPPVTATATDSPTIAPTQEVLSIQTSFVETASFREGLVGQVQRLNPLLAGYNPVDRDITSLIFEGLMRLNEFGEAVPALAKSGGIVISNDGREYIISLREDVLWQDGVPFNADDVIYTMSLLRSPDFPGPVEIGAFWQTIETEKLSHFQVRFRLSQPLGSFLTNLTIGILPFHALEGTGAADLANHPFNLSPIGTGPYQLQGFESRTGSGIDAVHLQSAPVYRQRAEAQSGYQIERFSFHLYNTFDQAAQALQAGEIDGLAARSRDERLSLFNIRDVILYNSLEPTLGVLIYQWDEGENRFFRDPRVRRALQLGVDRVTPVGRYLSNQAVSADSPLIRGSSAYTPGLVWPAYDPIAAAESLSTARIIIAPSDSEDTAPEQGGPLYQFSILVPAGTPMEGIATEIAAQWSQLSLNVSVEAVENADYAARIESGEFDAAIVELPLGADPDVYAYWHSGQYPDGKNYGALSDDRISESLERARRDAGGINRMQHYADFQQAFIERAVAIPLYYPLYTYAVSSQISGVQLGFIGSPIDRFRTLRDWSRQ